MKENERLQAGVFIVSQVMVYDIYIKTKYKPSLKLKLRQSVVQHTLHTYESMHLFCELFVLQ